MTYVHLPTLRAWTAANARARATYYADAAVRAGLCGTCGERKVNPPSARSCPSCRYRAKKGEK